MVGFDADDTLWRSQDYFDDAQAAYEAIMGEYLDLHQQEVQAHLLQIERQNVGLYGYGAKGMTLSMLQAAVEITQDRISARDIHRILELGRGLLAHPVELLEGIEDAVRDLGARHDLVLITKGDLFHQEAKVRQATLTPQFSRIEIVSEKDTATYSRLLREFEIEPSEFLMVGNSLKSDILPVVELGGWGVHVPYHSTWALEHAEAPRGEAAARLRVVNDASGLVAAVEALVEAAAVMPS